MEPESAVEGPPEDSAVSTGGTPNSSGNVPSSDAKQKTASPTGSSPYSTGGGGVSFAHSVAAVYLASMLTESRRPEASELPVRQVAFQTAPQHPVDDLLVTCGDDASQVTIAVACRASPDFVQSHEDTVKLVGSLIAEMEKFDTDSHVVAVAAAGRSNQWDQVAKLSDIARAHANANTFEASLEVEGRWPHAVRQRFVQLRAMVTKARGGPLSDAQVLHLSWRLLSRFRMLTFAVQTPDEQERAAVATLLDAVTDASADGVELRDKLELEAERYDRIGAVVDCNSLRRDVHRQLNVASTRTRAAWEVLQEHRKLAVDGLRATIGDDAAGGALKLSFSDRRESLTTALLAAAGGGGLPLLVHGESGTGKSALTLSTIAELEADHRGRFEAVIVNFKSLPPSTMELRTALGMSVQELLAELSAPLRILVIDAADAALERSTALLGDLVVAAKAAGVGVAAVSSDVASEFLSEQLTTGFGRTAVSFEVPPLADEHVELVAEKFSLLRPVLRGMPTNSLLRRPVVLDLLARTGVKLDGKLNEWDCLNLVWTNVVRGEGRSGTGSAQAREQTLLAVAASVMHIPPELRPAAGVDPEAVDALRRDHLLARASPYREQFEFAHDEVRRYATAILLVRAQDMTQVLAGSSVPRLALSAATLSCKGLFKDSTVEPKRRFLDLLGKFKTFAGEHGARWADVPVEAILETPSASECLRAALADKDAGLGLADVVRVVMQRHKVDGVIDPVVASAVVRILLDHEQPWEVSKESFELLAEWLQALVLTDPSEGNELRIALGARLIEHWNAYPPRQPSVDDDLRARTRSADSPVAHRRRRRGDLHYQVTGSDFVETLALLGADLNDETEECLRVLARDAPSFLAPAADSPVSARAVAQRDPELLAALMEAYYIDTELDWSHDGGLRRHQGRWMSVGGPFSMFYFGGFWQLCMFAHFKTHVRVVNNILNSAAEARIRTLSRPHRPDLFALSQDREAESDDSKITLDLEGTLRTYVGDSQVWGWYRGATVGPYPAMSALQAVERLIEEWLEYGIPASRVVEIFLEGCENLAMPAMLYGVLVRHHEKAGEALDRFLAEPAVWEFEFARSVQEHSGLAAPTEGLKNLHRRRWTPREVAFAMLTDGGEERIKALKKTGEFLTENGDTQGIDPERTRNWAASLDAEKYKLTPVPEGLRVEVEQPPEFHAAQEARAAHQEKFSTVVRLQNRYWGSGRDDTDYVPPSSQEIADDLRVCRVLVQDEEGMMSTRPEDAVAHVIRAAVERAAAGDPAALGDQGGFAAKFVLGVASTFRDGEGQRYEDQWFDLSADRAVAQALPAFITPALATALSDADGTVCDVVDLGFAMASAASRETRLYLARGCDIVWHTPCDGTPCTHQTALDWLVETARGAEIGPWDEIGYGRSAVAIEGDVVARLEELASDSVNTPVLDAVIRGLGAATSTLHCCTAKAESLLETLLDVQGQSLVAHQDPGWSVDDRGSRTLIAARALLHGYVKSGDPALVFGYLDTVRVHADIMANFLHGLAAAGVENENLANSARRLWPAVLSRAITYQNDDESPYMDLHWGDWAAAALLPDPLPWASGLHNEVIGAAIDWVCPEDLVDLIDNWLPLGRGQAKSVDALIGLLRRLPLDVQVTRGVGWVTELCIDSGRVTVSRSWLLNSWLKETRNVAEELNQLGNWQMLVDSLVVAGNEGLALYSR